KIRSEIEQVRLFEQEIENNKKVIKFFINYIPASLTFAEVSSLVNKEASSSGVNIESKEDSQYQGGNENTDYDVLNLKLRASGSFPQIMFFLSRLTSQKRLLIVDNINLSSTPNSEEIMSDINLLAYRYTGVNIDEQEKQTLEK
ncbi:MAG: type 4a pilus biogenesis protein PilO, partial [Bdellovibrionaceae bacterium]|nr:type 4a pilus biogenesis protein PilO [Pseudobdellovibrionaceae bacterium]